LAADLVRRGVMVIAATGGTVAGKAAKAATSTIPVLFVAGFDPVLEGLVESIARPGGNATGVGVYTAELGRKRLELLLQLVPRARKIAMLVNPGAISTEREIADVNAAARVLEESSPPDREPRPPFQILAVKASNDNEIDKAFAEAAGWGADAILVSADVVFTSRHPQIVALAARYALPASYPWPQYAYTGGLMSYGTDLEWAYRQIGEYAGRLLKGAKPDDLPVQLPTEFKMIINNDTAKSLGLSIPASLFPDEIIERKPDMK
jgi:putative ABC transport system substrate-binding protein